MTSSLPGDGGITSAWRAHQPYLVNLAYQMLGDVGDAQDVAQEVFLRLTCKDLAQIDDVRGWLTVVAGRLCLDQLRSARVRLETKLAPDQESALVDVDVTRDPAERIDATPRPVEVISPEHRRVTEAFITACANGDLRALTSLLDPTVWGVGTVLADAPPPPQVNHGPDDVAANLLRYLGPGATLVSGPPGELVLLAFHRGRLFAVVALTVRDGLVMKIEATADPAARQP